VSLRRLLAPGLFDAGCSSLATFLAGLYATRYFDPVLLGAYALFFTAFVLATVVPTQLVFTPAEIRGLPGAGIQRLRLLDRSIRLGIIPSLIPALLAASVALAGAEDVAISAMLPLATTAVLAAFISPIQDHVRRTLHLAGVSWRAAVVSIVQVLATGLSLAALTILGAPLGSVPFGALAVANVASLACGLFLARERHRLHELEPSDLHDLLRIGRWLLVGGATPAAAAFISGLLITHLAGAVAMGHVEAARLVGQPVLVLATGLSAITAPPLMEAGRGGEQRAGRRIGRGFEAAMLGGGLAYLAVVGPNWPLNPLLVIIPAAYQIGGLAALTVIANIVLALGSAYRYELLGGGRERTLIGLEGSAGALQCIATTTAAAIGSYAGPLGLLIQGAARWLLFQFARVRLYADAPSARGAER
jgi:hypothetical protein